MRAAPVALLVILLAPGAFAQAGAPPFEVEVELERALDEELAVRVRATAAQEIELPDGSSVRIAPGQDATYRVALPRPSPVMAIAPPASVLPRGSPSPTLVAPDGWGARSSEGAIVFVQDLHERATAVAGARVREVTSGPPGPEDRYLARGLAYLRGQHPSAVSEILLVRAPRELAGEGRAANDTVIVATDAPPAALAQQFARLHQRYRVVEVAPTSAAWFREGEARLQAEMSLVAAGLRTAEEVDAAFATARAVAEPDALLTQAPAGSTLARQKGLVVVRALDAELRSGTAGRAGLADLLERLDGARGRLDSAAIEEHARAVAGEGVGEFFERFVYGAEWPRAPGVRDGPDVFVLAFEVEPSRAMPGELVVARYLVVNRGTRPSAEGLTLTVDGGPALPVPLEAGVGERVNGTVGFSIATVGPHEVGLGAASAPLHVLAPGRLALSRVSTSPSEPAEDEAFTLLVYVQNAGEAPARGRVEVYEGDRLVQRTTEAVVEGNETDALTLPLRFDEAGLHVLEVRLVSEVGAGSIEHQVEVRLVDDARQETPLGGPALVAVALLAAGIGGRSMRR